MTIQDFEDSTKHLPKDTIINIVVGLKENEETISIKADGISFIDGELYLLNKLSISI